MVWLGAGSLGLTPLIIPDKGTVDHQRYISEVLQVALKYGGKLLAIVGHYSMMVPQEFPIIHWQRPLASQVSRSQPVGLLNLG
jgi:hypothetical protein